MTERERLIEELGNLVKKHSNSGISHKLSYTMKRWELELVAEFILEDRKRICAPLVEYKYMILKYSGLIGWVSLDNKQKEAIEETLRLSGLEEDK